MTSQPGRIRAIVDIPELNYSENEDVRSHPTFVRYRHEIWQLLREEKDTRWSIDASSQIQKIQIQSKTCVWTTRWSKCHQVQVRRGDARSEHFVRRLGTVVRSERTRISIFSLFGVVFRNTIVLIVFFGLWEVLPRAGVVSSTFVPPFLGWSSRGGHCCKVVNFSRRWARVCSDPFTGFGLALLIFIRSDF